MGENRNAYVLLVGKTEGKRTLEKPSLFLLYNIKTDLKEMGWEGVDIIYVVQDRVKCRAVVNVVMNLLGFIKCGQFLD
jgi:hypothetical protein